MITANREDKEFRWKGVQLSGTDSETVTAPRDCYSGCVVYSVPRIYYKDCARTKGDGYASETVDVGLESETV